MGQRMKRKIVGHAAFFGGGSDVNRGARRQGDINVAGVIGEGVVATIAEVAVVSDFGVGGIYRNHAPVGVLQADRTADGDNFHIAMGQILEADGAAQGVGVNVAAIGLAHDDVGGIAFQSHIGIHALNRN